MIDYVMVHGGRGSFFEMSCDRCGGTVNTDQFERTQANRILGESGVMGLAREAGWKISTKAWASLPGKSVEVHECPECLALIESDG